MDQTFATDVQFKEGQCLQQTQACTESWHLIMLSSHWPDNMRRQLLSPLHFFATTPQFIFWTMNRAIAIVAVLTALFQFCFLWLIRILKGCKRHATISTCQHYLALSISYKNSYIFFQAGRNIWGSASGYFSKKLFTSPLLNAFS